MLKIVSWNINGLRAILRKPDFTDFIRAEQPDIICLQETKAKQGQAPLDLPEYEEYWHSAARAGYSGTAIFTAVPPLSVENHQLPIADLYGDLATEGRILTMEFADFYLVDVYVPNSKRDLSRLQLRHQEWDPRFLAYLKELEKSKPVITCGDFNAAHTEIDIARPRDNVNNAGFTPEERQGITNLLNAGFIDTYRHLHPTDAQYTWWSFRPGVRARNIGWRIDYFFVSKSLAPQLKSATIHDQILGSDHCPVSIEIEVNP